mgnify:CR=1 FL=1
MGSTKDSTKQTLDDERSEVLQQLEDWLEIPMLVLGLDGLAQKFDSPLFIILRAGDARVQAALHLDLDAAAISLVQVAPGNADQTARGADQLSPSSRL